MNKELAGFRKMVENFRDVVAPWRENFATSLENTAKEEPANDPEFARLVRRTQGLARDVLREADKVHLDALLRAVDRADDYLAAVDEVVRYAGEKSWPT